MNKKYLLGLAVSLLMMSCAEKSGVKGFDPDEVQLQVGDSIAIAQTTYGKVQGYILRGIYTFCGIPYGRIREGKTVSCHLLLQKHGMGLNPACSGEILLLRS